jgi:hypothetical protein
MTSTGITFHQTLSYHLKDTTECLSNGDKHTILTFNLRAASDLLDQIFLTTLKITTLANHIFFQVISFNFQEMVTYFNDMKKVIKALGYMTLGYSILMIPIIGQIFGKHCPKANSACDNELEKINPQSLDNSEIANPYLPKKNTVKRVFYELSTTPSKLVKISIFTLFMVNQFFSGVVLLDKAKLKNSCEIFTLPKWIFSWLVIDPASNLIGVFQSVFNKKPETAP